MRLDAALSSSPSGVHPAFAGKSGVLRHPPASGEQASGLRAVFRMDARFHARRVRRSSRGDAA
jgi:hypothetical protein